MPFRFTRLEIPDVIEIQLVPHPDRRGFFAEIYRQSEFEAHGIRGPFVQDNRSRSFRGVLRGLHYQKAPAAQAKLVTVLSGKIFDVAVDIRRGSPTYGRWVGTVLSGEDGRMLYIPVGFAHGFCVLSEVADVLYKVTAEYAPELERGIRWDDPDIGIRWPISDPILSPKDLTLPFLKDADHDFFYDTTRGA
ncbi:MAG: dTDP-4-dehydrorhamnose 3,5-epimerase [Armatimonadota bacterium]|nr:dTDP-4-dehydrorhamnose 3,5-epimerase [Armatimonadota bacterium]